MQRAQVSACFHVISLLAGWLLSLNANGQSASEQAPVTASPTSADACGDDESRLEAASSTHMFGIDWTPTKPLAALLLVCGGNDVWRAHRIYS